MGLGNVFLNFVPEEVHKKRERHVVSIFVLFLSIFGRFFPPGISLAELRGREDWRKRGGKEERNGNSRG